jgi:hypothetical protein
MASGRPIGIQSGTLGQTVLVYPGAHGNQSESEAVQVGALLVRYLWFFSTANLAQKITSFGPTLDLGLARIHDVSPSPTTVRQQRTDAQIHGG